MRSALFVTHSVCMSHDGTTCCGFRPTLNLSITLKVVGIDHVDVVRLHVRDVDALEVAGEGGAHLAGGGLAVEVGGIDDGRHAGNGFHGIRGGAGERGTGRARREKRIFAAVIREVSGRAVAQF